MEHVKSSHISLCTIQCLAYSLIAQEKSMNANKIEQTMTST